MLEEKTYKVSIVGSFTGVSPEKKTPFIGLELETECGEYIDWIQYITENNAKLSIKTLTEVGFVGKKISDLSNPKLDMEDLFKPSATITAVIEHEEWADDQGEIKKKAKVKWLNCGSSGPERADHSKAVKIFAGKSYDGMLKQMQQKLGSKKTAAPKTETKDSSPEGSGVIDDDIPF